MKDLRIPDDAIEQGLNELVGAGALQAWEGPSKAVGNNRRSWLLTFNDDRQDWYSAGECWCYIRGARDFGAALLGVS